MLNSVCHADNVVSGAAPSAMVLRILISKRRGVWLSRHSGTATTLHCNNEVNTVSGSDMIVCAHRR